MYQPKEEIYKVLKSLGYACQQGSQAIFTEVVVDIFTNKSTDLSRILSEVEAKMRTINYRLVHSVDVPNPEGTLFHSNCRFSAVKFK